jgi:hypothetical protein
VRHLDASHLLEQLARQVRRGPDAGGRKCDLALALSGECDELRDRFRRRRVGGQQQERKGAHQGDRRKIAEGVRQRTVEQAAGRKRPAADEDRVAVGVRACDRRGADIGAGARLVLDHHLLAPDPGQPVGSDAGYGVGRSAGRIRNHNARRADRPSADRRRLGPPNGGRKHGRRGNDNEPATVDDAGCVHDVPRIGAVTVAEIKRQRNPKAKLNRQLKRIPVKWTQRARHTRSAPSPLVGEGWGGGWRVWQRRRIYLTTPTPNPSPQGGGERTSARHVCGSNRTELALVLACRAGTRFTSRVPRAHPLSRARRGRASPACRGDECRTRRARSRWHSSPT